MYKNPGPPWPHTSGGIANQASSSDSSAMPSQRDHSQRAVWAAALIQARRTIRPKHLVGPGPDADHKTLILQAAATAPDHHNTQPWRFIEVPIDLRDTLGRAFEAALLERDPTASADACTKARDKAQRSPWLLLAVLRLADANQTPPEEPPPAERLLSAGAAIQNILLMCTALGLGSSLTSGKAINSTPLRQLFQLADHEQGLCFINVGHSLKAPETAKRPAISHYFSTLVAP